MEEIMDVGMVKVTCNDGSIKALDHDEITGLIFKALKSVGNTDRLTALNLADKFMYRISTWQTSEVSISMNDIENMVKFVLFESGYSEALKYFDNNKEVPYFNWG